MHKRDPMHTGTLQAREKGQTVGLCTAPVWLGSSTFADVPARGDALPVKDNGVLPAPCTNLSFQPLNTHPADHSQNPCGQPKSKQSRDDPAGKPCTVGATIHPCTPSPWMQRSLQGEENPQTPFLMPRARCLHHPRAMLALAAGSWARGGWKHPEGCRIRPPVARLHEEPWRTSRQPGRALWFPASPGSRAAVRRN